MNYLRYTIAAVFIAVIMTACGGGGSKTQGDKEQPKEPAKPAKPEVTLSKVTGSPDFEGVKLSLATPVEGALGAVDKINFDFAIDGDYKLGEATIDADIKGCANSNQGQHIHLIVNNRPYTAHYNNEFERGINEGHKIALAFVSRSYHESIKSEGAYVLTQFTVGDGPHEEKDLSGEHMFYSRPKGTYKGADTKKVMLDFYLVNTTISAEGNKVKATINGKQFMIDDWAPYFIEGLPMGETTIQLELVDKDGNTIPGPFNKVTRKIKLEQGA